ncbi:arginine--tRNA ligase [Algiphilus sp.]|uniref:arginine--tRNA ligase n=1 Tax=Algiphilus sp. TaxID=1872431 RepID=UPI003BAAA405
MKADVQALLLTACRSLFEEAGQPDAAPDTAHIENTRDPEHGDLASNLAMTLAKPLKRAPRQIAEALVARLPAHPHVAKVEIAGPGFINFFLSPSAWQATAHAILATGAEWGFDRSGSKGRILVEFVSANPTGPMHVGHGRNAAYGDALARILAAAGWAVSREYYVNDAGRQVDVLTISAWLRYLEACGESVRLPARGYPGDYLVATGTALHAAQGDAYHVAADTVFDGLPEEPTEGEKEALKRGQEQYLDALITRAHALLGEAHYAAVRDFALEAQLGTIRDTLERFGVAFDAYASERAVVASGAPSRALARLREQGHVYEQEGAVWLRTSALGDEKDRVLYKSDGAATYFANDLAYHEDKVERGFDTLIDVWGADHHGYIGRVRAAIQALTGRTDALEVTLIQFVSLSSGRMGKRSGNFVTLADLIEEVGTDATRFFYLSRSQDQHLEFDLELAKRQSNDNPVYYVQYAHARICSVFAQAAAQDIRVPTQASLDALAPLTTMHEIDLLKQLTRFPELLQTAAEHRAPHMISFYLRDLADALHSYYNAHKVLIDDRATRDARLALLAATQSVLASGLQLLGVSAPETM